MGTLTGITKELLGSPNTELLKIDGVIGITAIQINLLGGNAPNNWQQIFEIRMYDDQDNEFFTSLTAIGETANSLEDLSAGEFTSNSLYQGVDSVAVIVNGIPDINNPNASAGTGEWSSSSLAELIIFAKPLTPKVISKIDICTYSGGIYAINPANTTFEFDGVLVTPTVSPTNAADVYQTTGNSNVNWFRWEF